MSKDTKDSLITFLASENDKRLISEKMKLAGITNLSAYLRKMAIDGYIVNLDIGEVYELLTLMRRTSANINQIAKRVNITGNIYADDIEEISYRQNEIINLLKKTLDKLSSIN